MLDPDKVLFELYRRAISQLEQRNARIHSHLR